MTTVIASFLIAVFVFQSSPSIDSSSPKEREAAIAISLFEGSFVPAKAGDNPKPKQKIVQTGGQLFASRIKNQFIANLFAAVRAIPAAEPLQKMLEAAQG